MGRPSLPIEIQNKIKQMALTMSNNEIARQLKIGRNRVAKVLVKPGEETHSKIKNSRSILYKMEKRNLAPGCLNVHERSDWLTG